MIKAAYIHIPFCENICHYCDFNKFFIEGQPVNEYLDALGKEIALTLEQFPKGSLNSIYVGGGTPTALNEGQLGKLCELIHKHLSFGVNTEFTFEANPGDLSKEKLEILKEAGVNRLSLGVQTFNDELLRKIGRTHRAKDVFHSVDLAKQIGFENINIDLIYSLPEQTINDFKETLEIAFSLDIVHYSGYSLIIEPKTVFYNLMKKGRLPLPGEDTEAAMYEMLMDEMDKNGFKQYEISNFAKPGFESRHNLTYWNNEHYYGFGAGAHSYINGRRITNFGPLKKYMGTIQEGKLPIMESLTLTETEKIEEEMFLGLRKTTGVSIRQFAEKYGRDPLHLFKEEIEKLEAKGLIKVTNEKIYLTRNGKLLGNEVFQSFIGVI
ncbi:oxygen-independent coproporphyrinogen III oxidase [Bacillus methanolicus]|uniref:radical SAM family heme chaperone HemW n=1 Tax=Bacillus methanolicus TaxID=1471 RepID=UPI00200DBAF3|nr:radical SAM family heme chaperone HemW [Bacillus methanolicus]UQD52808.1 oxygen-independent coproporphyrinogen III oxidase [Bacillus methanolicus]